MYSLSIIIPSKATVNFAIRNLETGTIDLCFDDSMFVNFDDYGPMGIDRIGGEKFDCKIALVGHATQTREEGTVVCKIVDANAYVGKRRMIKVSVREDEYYVNPKDLEGISYDDYFCFDCIRKDLIQVDDLIREDYLN